MTTDIRPWNSIATTYFLAYMRRREAWDTFSHDETNSFGSLETSTDTQAWTSTGGSASDYQVADGIASHLMTNGTLRLSYTTDFSLADGDRVQLDPGTQFTVAQVGADTVISMAAGQMILVGVQMSTLTPGWIFGA